MNVKAVIPREQANEDVRQALDFYTEAGGTRVGLNFVDALERCYGAIGRNSAAGSNRYSYELNIPDLKFWVMADFPYSVFYIDRSDHADVWRVLHNKQHIPDKLSRQAPSVL